MKKSQLLAQLANYNEELIEIDANIFSSAFRSNNLSEKDMQHYLYKDHSGEVYSYHTDGWNYYWYSAAYQVNGDWDGDSYFCKVKTITYAEMEELQKMFAMQA